MPFLYEKCTLRVYDETILKTCKPFDCGDKDLNEFFVKDVIDYTSELLGKSYCFTLDNDETEIVAAFTVSNDSVKTFILPNARKKKINTVIPFRKHLRSYPAVLIGRLGVSLKYRKSFAEDKSIGNQLMDFLKSWFVANEYITGCRFLVVDAYNEEKTLFYYKRNGFMELFSTNEQEKKHAGFPIDYELKTRLLYYDLILIS